MLKFLSSNAVRKECIHRYLTRFKDHETCRKVIDKLLYTKQTQPTDCPHCNHSSIVRYGKYRDRQRYKCRGCNRTFNDLTNTPLHYTHAPLKWIKFIHCLIQKLTLAETCDEVKITYTTAHYWRHKLIHALERIDCDFTKGAPCPGSYPYICVRQYPPDSPGDSHERMEFSKWISSFNWIARKYVDRYIAWFRFVRKLNLKQELESIQQLLISACSISLRQTYATV